MSARSRGNPRRLTSPQVEYFKKQRVVNYQKEQTIKRLEQQGGEITAPQLPLPGQK